MLFYFCFCDASFPWQYGIQDPATPVAVGIYKFHHDLIFVLIFVVFFVFWIIFRILYFFNRRAFPVPTSVVHGTTIEVIWTIMPAILLIIIGIPSFSLLYAVDEVVNPSITLKVTGNQWYWNYEYSDYENSDNSSISFDSYILTDSDLSLGTLRLLEVDNRVVLPSSTHIRLIVTSTDVLHSWSVPSFGIKIDACPGRLNESSLFVERRGVFYGQCSELCGVNHGFIPISVEVLSMADYLSWVSIKLEDFLLLFYGKFLSARIFYICFFSSLW